MVSSHLKPCVDESYTTEKCGRNNGTSKRGKNGWGVLHMCCWLEKKFPLSPGSIFGKGGRLMRGSIAMVGSLVDRLVGWLMGSSLGRLQKWPPFDDVQVSERSRQGAW